MVRFSDLLGGNSDAEDARAVSVPALPIPAADPAEAEAEAEGAAGAEPDRDEPDGVAADPHNLLAAFAIDETAPAPVESPQDVLDRLTQYATSARAGDQVPDIPAPPAPAAAMRDESPAATTTGATSTTGDDDDSSAAGDGLEPFTPVGDDLLPRSVSSRKQGRGRKRRP